MIGGVPPPGGCRPVRWLRPHRRPSFTLIELVIVIAIVGVLLSAILPGAARMWEQRKHSDAENILRGMLMTARARAIRDNGTDSGLFFFLTAAGVQRVVPIEQDNQNASRLAWQNVFRVSAERIYTLPPPIRVVPRHAVATPSPTPSGDLAGFSNVELVNNDFEDPLTPFNKAQSHRNYFSVVYGSDGRLMIRRDVVILDENKALKPASDGRLRGDTTGLVIGHDTSGAGKATVERFYDQTDLPVPFDRNTLEKIPYAIVDRQNVAINFPSIDGLVVHDDSLFGGLETPSEKRRYLVEQGQPLYINRLTGAVIRGTVSDQL